VSEDPGFLSRWSRRKAEARKEAETAVRPQTQAVEEEAAGSFAESSHDNPAALSGGEQAAPVDLSKLPAIETIDAATDIKAFLAKGVPDSLRTAALRQVWASDPAIRDYVGPYDYAWDFNQPATHGFGALPPDIDVTRIVRTIMEGHGPSEEDVAGTSDAVALQSEIEDLKRPPEAESLEASDEVSIGHTEASSIDEPRQAENRSHAPSPPRRRHGGATPR
jgi:hypothetical protein